MGVSGAWLALPLAAPAAATASRLNQQVIAEPGSPPAEQEQGYRKWTRQQEEHVLAEARRALATKDPAPLLRLYDWNGVPPKSKESSTRAAKELVQRKIESVVIQPKGLGGNIGYLEGGRLFTPNGTVVAHLVFKSNDGSGALDFPLGMKDDKLVILGFSPQASQ